MKRMTTKATTGKRIRERREHLSMTQAELGRKVGVDGTKVYRWEADRNEPDLEELDRLAEALHVSRAWLAWGQK